MQKSIMNKAKRMKIMVKMKMTVHLKMLTKMVLMVAETMDIMQKNRWKSHNVF